MEKYRQSLKMQNLLIAVGTLCLIAVQVLAFCGVFAPTVSDAHWAGMYAGFIAGAAFGVTVLFVIGLIRNLLALRSEKKLRRLYAKNNDERRIQVCDKALSGAFRTCLLALLVAVIVTGYFSIPVSLTCLVIVFVQEVAGDLFKLFWNRKL